MSESATFNVIEGSQCVLIAEAEHNALLDLVRAVENLRLEIVSGRTVVDFGLCWEALARVYDANPTLRPER